MDSGEPIQDHDLPLELESLPRVEGKGVQIKSFSQHHTLDLLRGAAQRTEMESRSAKPREGRDSACGNRRPAGEL